MGLEQVYYVAGIIASLAVVASLVYLSLQVRQSNALSRAQTRQSMMELANTQILVLVEHPEIFTYWTKEDMTEIENIKLNSYLLAAMRAREYEWFAHRDGAIDSAMFAGYSKVITGFLSSERTKKWWSLRGVGEFHPEFVSYVDSLLAGGDSLDWTSQTKM